MKYVGYACGMSKFYNSGAANKSSGVSMNHPSWVFIMGPAFPNQVLEKKREAFGGVLL